MPTGALIRKQFIVFPVEAPLSPDPVEITTRFDFLAYGARPISWIWGQVRNNLHCAVMAKLEP